MRRQGAGERAPWGDFPNVIRNGDLGQLKKGPEYSAAKAGDSAAALAIATRLTSDETIAQVAALIGEQRARIVPVMAAEATGHNKIPLAFACVIADRLGLDVELGIVQAERVHRTGAGADHRLAFNPTFVGGVTPGASYVVVDDTLAMGGTIASLRGYIENRGGKVIGACAMVAHPGAVSLPVKAGMLAAIAAKHGDAMNKYWQEEFGYGIDRLTQGEAGHLKAAHSVDAIRDRIAAARHARIGDVHDGVPQGGSGREGQAALIVSNELVSAADGAERATVSTLDAATIEQSYSETLTGFVQAKQAQVSAIESRLERLIAGQQDQLQRVQTRRPGLLSLPRARQQWQSEQGQCLARLQTLHARLEVVREIRDGQGLFSPKIEELATRKMRAAHPELASDWDAMREAMRKEDVQSQGAKRGRGAAVARGHRLGVSPD